MLAIHSDVLDLLRLIRESGNPPLEALPPEQSRRLYLAGRRSLQPPPDQVSLVRDLHAPSQDSPVPLRLYRGMGTANDAVLPCLLYLHGGGWVVGSVESHDGVCRQLANLTAGCVISVEYRLAPEHPFPAAVEDAAAALTYVVAQAESLMIDPARIAVGGDSAGGNLAAVLALMGRDGAVPRTVFQALLYPAVDLTMTSDGYRRVTEGMPLTAATMLYFVSHYVPHHPERLDWRASPLRTTSLAGAPPALVLTCGHDPLCEEGRLYAKRLEDEGVPVTALHLSDQTHGILTMGKIIRATASTLTFMAHALCDAWTAR